jgi:putative toxin-antitoxin system antitoxin component (TIGR02293 family)
MYNPGHLVETAIFGVFWRLRHFCLNFGKNVAMAKSKKVYIKKGDTVIHYEGDTSYKNVIRWLGGARVIKHKIDSEYDYITIGNEGLTTTSIDELAHALGISRKSIAEKIFDMSVKTLERKAPRERLDKRTSSHAIEIAKLMSHAYEVFQDEEKIRHWVSTSNLALNDKTPLALMDTLTGLRMIDDVLGRIQEGVYS